MSAALLIDPDGYCWPDDSSDLARQLGYRDPEMFLPLYALRDHGFIHVRPHAEGVHVALRAATIARPAIAGLIYVLADLVPRRMLLAMMRDCAEEWDYELHSDPADLVERVEGLSLAGPVQLSRPWLATRRRMTAINQPRFAGVQHLASMWRFSRGHMSDDLAQAISVHPLRNRTILMRRPVRSSRLIVDHFGASITILRPCEALQLVGRDFALPDPAYQGWCEEAYNRTIRERRLRLESIVARVSTSQAAIVRIRYDRLLMPLSGSGADTWLLCVSMRRELSRVA